MGLQEVGLEYVSKNAGKFISDVHTATASLETLNYRLLNIGNGSSIYDKALNSATKSSTQFAKSGDVITVSLDKTNSAIQNQTNQLQSYDKQAGSTIKTISSASSQIVKFGTSIGKSAKDADTAADSLDDIGDGFNRVENTARIAAIGVSIFGRLLGVNTKVLKQVTGGLDEFADGADKISDTFAKYADKVDKADGKIRDFDKEHGRLKNNFLEGIPVFGLAGNALSQLAQVYEENDNKIALLKIGLKQLVKRFKLIPAPVLAATSAIAAFNVASKVVEFIGSRSAGLNAISDSFENLRQEAGLASDFLETLASRADNQLTQAQLLVKANRALAGSTGEFATELANSLPTLLDFARARSAATGEDVDFLFESLIQGIKKQQPLILDNLGLVVNLEETYEAYAQTIGKTASQLTGVQKQQALLNSVNEEAIRNINVLGGVSLSNADKQNAKKNIYSDIFDNISLSIQGLFSAFLDIEVFFLRLTQGTLQPLIDTMGSVFDVFGNLLSGVFEALKPVFEPVFVFVQLLIAPFEALGRILARISERFLSMGKTIGVILSPLKLLTPIFNGLIQVFTTIADLVIGVIDFFDLLANTIGSALIPILTPFANMLDAINERFNGIGETVKQLGIILAVGFGASVASLVNTFLRASIQITRIVADLAQTIADFLIGQSPPPKGPLSKIDKGGQSTFEAWLDGFSNASLKPVEQVTNEVNATLGNIGSFNINQVEARLAQLDLAIRPFNEQLQIAQSRFDAISKPAEAALNAIDRQMNTAIKALTQGDVDAKKSVQALDAQRASIYKNLELQQQQVDFAQIQLALAQSKQTEERALLNIQKARLSGNEKEAKQIEKAMKKSSGARGGITTPRGGAGGTTPSGAMKGGSTQQDSATGSALGDWMLEGFGAEFNTDLFAELQDEQSRLGEETGRVGEGLAGLGDRLLSPFDDLFGEGGTLNTLFSDFFGSEGTIMTFVNDLFGSEGSISTAFGNVFGSEGSIANAFNGMFGEGGTLRTSVSNFANSIGNNFSEGSAFRTSFDAIFGEEGTISTAFTNLFGEDSTLNTILTTFFGEEGTIFNLLATAKSIFVSFRDAISSKVDDIIDYFTGEDSLYTTLTGLFSEEGDLSSLMATGITLFTGLYTAIFGEEGIFTGIASALQTMIVTPILGLITGIQSAINAIIQFAEDTVNGVFEGLDENIIQRIPANLRGPLNNLSGLAIDLPEVQFTLPTINLLGAKSGGLFTGGRLMVGEAGKEIITSAEKKAVFPNEFVTSLQSLESVLVSFMSIMPTMMTSNNQNNSNFTQNQTININQPQNPATIRQNLSLIG